MKIDTAFELLAEKYNLDLNRKENIYTDLKTILAYNFWIARQPEIDQLKFAMSAIGILQEKIEKLEHDLASEKCACNIFQHLAGKELEKENAQ